MATIMVYPCDFQEGDRLFIDGETGYWEIMWVRGDYNCEAVAYVDNIDGIQGEKIVNFFEDITYEVEREN